MPNWKLIMIGVYTAHVERVCGLLLASDVTGSLSFWNRRSPLASFKHNFIKRRFALQLQTECRGGTCAPVLRVFKHLLISISTRWWSLGQTRCFNKMTSKLAAAATSGATCLQFSWWHIWVIQKIMIDGARSWQQGVSNGVNCSKKQFRFELHTKPNSMAYLPNCLRWSVHAFRSV